MHHVFLSYSHKDIWIMRSVLAYLRSVGLEVWVDESLKPGTPDWEKAIQHGIEESACVAVILSPEAARSPWVGLEIEYANIQKKAIFPILASGEPEESRPISLLRTQYVDIRNSYEMEMHKLVEAIHQRLEIDKVLNTHLYNRNVQKSFPDKFIFDLKTSREVWIRGLHHLTLMIAQPDLFDRVIESAESIRIIAIDPYGIALKMALMRFRSPMLKVEQARCEQYLCKLYELQRKFPSRLHIRTVDYLLEYSAFLVNPETVNGITYMERYTFRTQGGHEKPKLIFSRKSNPDWYKLFYDEFVLLWNASEIKDLDVTTIKCDEKFH